MSNRSLEDKVERVGFKVKGAQWEAQQLQEKVHSAANIDGNMIMTMNAKFQEINNKIEEIHYFYKKNMEDLRRNRRHRKEGDDDDHPHPHRDDDDDHRQGDHEFLLSLNSEIQNHLSQHRDHDEHGHSEHRRNRDERRHDDDDHPHRYGDDRRPSRDERRPMRPSNYTRPSNHSSMPMHGQNGTHH